MTLDTLQLGAFCAAQFEAVEMAFRANLTDGGDIGAAFALVCDGELVVDLWGGYCDEDRTAEWTHDTVANVWSTSKGVTATCIAMLVDRGTLSYEQRVAHYWPEFAAAGKADITVSMMLSHQAGLAGFRDPMGIADLYDQEGVSRRLAAMEPWWEPGSQSGYHAITMGHLANELVMRATGQSLGQFAERELARFDYSVGLTPPRSRRAATMSAPDQLGSTDIATDLSALQLAVLANPVLDPLLPNTSAWRAAELPSANGFATARGLAQLYGELAMEGGSLMRRETIERASAVEKSGMDAVLGIDAPWACGFLRNTQGIYGPNMSAFGHSGWGGSFAFADPARKIGMGYVMNHMGTDLMGDPRGVALVDAAYRSLGDAHAI